MYPANVLDGIDFFKKHTLESSNGTLMQKPLDICVVFR